MNTFQLRDFRLQELVKLVLDDVCKRTPSIKSFVEVGSGSGAISLALLNFLPNRQVTPCFILDALRRKNRGVVDCNWWPLVLSILISVPNSFPEVSLQQAKRQRCLWRCTSQTMSRTAHSFPTRQSIVVPTAAWDCH